MAGIRDVARLAGVAPSTVSLVLNNKGYVSLDTRRKVEKAVKDLSYMPSTIARNLSLNRTNIIGVIVPEVLHPFYSELVHELEQALYLRGYKMLLCSSSNKEKAEVLFVDMLKTHTMDGIIVGTHSMDLSIYEGIDRPIVAFDRIINDRIPVVHADHVQGGELAAKAMLHQDCHHIVQVIGAQNVRCPANEYHIAFEKKIREAGCMIDTIEMERNVFSPEAFYRVMSEVFERYPDVDGIFGADLIICAALAAAQEHGKRIPEDVKAVAYDGTYVTRLSPFAITAAVQPLQELAGIAADTISRMIMGEAPGSIPVPKLTLQKGATC
ncbi:MAG: LacI family DNA-binding transcriptional regulator [Selenomonas sp.]|jgi:LacI family sucrose operon transcriptional repressor|nr:LacI family DNA-binding transcriptional regulator [Selenomonas sp.]